MISLIIPVFNVDVALLKCLLESITLKSDFEFEIIIVDDCSTNIDLLNFESYIENQPHCKVISTGKNSGPGVARNIGIENANGNWCMFADADDFYSQGAIKIVNSTLINKNPNAIIFDYNIVAGNTVKMKSLSNSDQYISKSEIQELLVGSTELNNIWRCAFSLDIIRENNVSFPSDMRNGEDFIFMIEYFKHCDEVIHLKKPLYNYRINENGITQNFTLSKIDDAVKTLQYRYQLLDLNFHENTKANISLFIQNKYIQVLFDYMALAYKNKEFSYVQIIKNNKYCQRLLNDKSESLVTNLKRKIIISYNPLLLIFFYTIKECVKSFVIKIRNF